MTNKPIPERRPGELAIYAHNYLKYSGKFTGELYILDAGCCEGHDSFFLAENLDCHIVAVDISAKAIATAKASCLPELQKRIEFLCFDVNNLVDKYDIIFASQLYQVLNPDGRVKFRETVKRCLKKGGLLFLSTLSLNDPYFSATAHQSGNGQDGSETSPYLSSRVELENDFDFLYISALFERSYNVQVEGSTVRRHTYWIMMGEMI